MDKKNKMRSKNKLLPMKIAIKHLKKTISEPIGANKAVNKKELNSVRDTKIKVIGVGGGGGSIVNGLAGRLNRVSFYALNTDLQALGKLGTKIKKISFGQEQTHGLGTGRNSDLGQTVAISDRDRWKKAITGANQGDLYIIVACLGGGVGSGATPVIAKALKDTGGIVYGIFTLPFEFEGEKKIAMAQVAVEKMRPYLNAYTIIPNEAVFAIVNRDAPLNQALQAINDNLGQSLFGLLETIYEPGAINIDFADLRAIFEGHGRLAYLNTISTGGPDRGSKAVNGVLSSMLYSYSARGAKGIIYNIKGHKLTLEEINLVSRAINESASKDAKIIFGLSRNHVVGGEMKVTILATGCQTKLFASKNENNLPKEPIKKKSLKKKNKKKEIKLSNINPIEEKKSGVKTGKHNKNNASKKKPIIVDNNNHETEERKDKQTGFDNKEEVAIKEPTVSLPDNDQKIVPVGVKVRRNANQIKRAAEEIEEEMLREEKKWEIPAFMRKTLNDNNPQTS